MPPDGCFNRLAHVPSDDDLERLVAKDSAHEEIADLQQRDGGGARVRDGGRKKQGELWAPITSEAPEESWEN